MRLKRGSAVAASDCCRIRILGSSIGKKFRPTRRTVEQIHPGQRFSCNCLCGGTRGCDETAGPARIGEAPDARAAWSKAARRPSPCAQRSPAPVVARSPRTIIALIQARLLTWLLVWVSAGSVIVWLLLRLRRRHVLTPLEWFAPLREALVRGKQSRQCYRPARSPPPWRKEWRIVSHRERRGTFSGCTVPRVCACHLNRVSL